MNVWAIVLYILEALTLAGVVTGLNQKAKGPISFGSVGFVFGLVIAALGFFAIYRLTQQSSADHAVALGVTYAVISAVGVLDLIRHTMKGEIRYTSGRGIVVTIAAIAGIVLTSILAFAG